MNKIFTSIKHKSAYVLWVSLFLSLSAYAQLDIIPLPNSNLSDLNILLFQDDMTGDHHEAALICEDYWNEFCNDYGCQVDITNQASDMNTSNLRDINLIIFNYTNNVYNKFDGTQKSVFEDYIADGGHWIGYHTASMPRDGQWNWYRENIIIGFYNPNYHGTQEGSMVKTTEEDILKSPVIEGMPDVFVGDDEWYAFNQGPLFDEAVVLYYVDEGSLDPHTHEYLDSYQMSLPVELRHPIMWYRKDPQTGSRVFYTGIIHTPGSANTDFFKLTLLRAAEYVSGIPGCPDTSYEEYTEARTEDDSSLCVTPKEVGIENGAVLYGDHVTIDQRLDEIFIRVRYQGDYAVLLQNVKGETVKKVALENSNHLVLSTADVDHGAYLLKIMRAGRPVEGRLISF
jgi:hypothetical protein